MQVSASTRNQATAFPPFAPGVAFPSVYERAGFDVNKSHYAHGNGSQTSIRSGRSGRSQATSVSGRTASPAPSQLYARTAPEVTPIAPTAHPATTPLPAAAGGGGSIASQGKGPALCISTTNEPRPTVSVSPRLSNTRYPFYHKKEQTNGSGNQQLASPVTPIRENIYTAPAATAPAALPSALQFTPPPKAEARETFPAEASTASDYPTEAMSPPHSRQGSAGTDISMVSALTASSHANSPSETSTHHNSSYTDATSWDSEEPGDVSQMSFKQNLLVPQHLDNRLSTTSSIYSINPTMDHIPDQRYPAMPDTASPESPVVGLGVHGIEFPNPGRSSEVISPGPTSSHNEAARKFLMTTPPLEIHRQSTPQTFGTHPSRGGSMQSGMSANSSATDSTAAASSSQKPAKVCRGCSGVISKKGIRSREGNLSGRWHKECFKCVSCEHPLDSEVYVYDDAPHCGECYHRASNSTCRGCGKGVEGQCMETRAENSNFGTHAIRYHNECLRCVDCQCLLHDSYYVVDGGNYCYSHAIEAQPVSDERLERRYTRFAMI